MQLGKITPDDLILLIDLFPKFEEAFEELRNKFRIDADKAIVPEAIKPSWYELYEMPYIEHFAHVTVLTGQLDDVKALVKSEKPSHAAVLKAVHELETIDDADGPFSEEDRLLVPIVFGWGLSLYLTLKSLLVFGQYLNDLVALADRSDKIGDKALFNAVKIDPTVIACTNVINRISLAVMQNDKSFFKGLKNAVSGKLTQRENRLYQMQRLVLQVLIEVKAPKLNQEELYELFVNQLKIATRDNDSDVGDVANNLRQFAYQFMKQKSVRQNG